MFEIDAGQAGPAAKLALLHEVARAFAVGGEIERVAWPEAAGDPVGGDQLGKAGDRSTTAAVDAGRALEAVIILEFGERAVDFPLQHRRARRGAAETGLLPVDERHGKTARRQMFGNQGTGDAAADYCDVGGKALLDRPPCRPYAALPPERTAAH